MDIKKITLQLKEAYSTAEIVLEPHENPKAVHAVTKAQDGSSSVTVSVVDEIPAHHHKRTAEIYFVMKGSLTLFVNGETFILKEGDYHIVPPGETHWAQGNETWLEVYAEPGLVIEDVYYGEPQAIITFPHQSRLITSDVPVTRDILTSVFHCTVMEEDARRAVLRCGDTTITIVSHDTLPKELKDVHGYVIIDHSSLDKAIEEASKKDLALLFRQGALAFLCDSSHNVFELHERQTN